MKVLIVGSGGREHAIAWSVSRSPKADKIYCAPGNAGIAEYAECVNIGAMEFEKLADFAQENQIDLTIIGMDDPLVGGIVDEFREAWAALTALSSSESSGMNRRAMESDVAKSRTGRPKRPKGENRRRSPSESSAGVESAMSKRLAHTSRSSRRATAIPASHPEAATL